MHDCKGKSVSLIEMIGRLVAAFVMGIGPGLIVQAITKDSDLAVVTVLIVMYIYRSEREIIKEIEQRGLRGVSIKYGGTEINR